MIVYENECCDCAVPGYPCLGNACSLTHVPHIYCDECGEEIYDDEHGYELSDNYHLCSKCDDEEEDEDDE